MKKIITAAMAALTLGGAAMASAVPAEAAPHGYYHGGYGYHGGYRGGGGALLAGVAGLAIGAAIADSGRPHYYAPGPYYYGGPGYYSGYATCYGRTRVWDPYVGRWIIERTPYAC
jgi:hypothetical protein